MATIQSLIILCIGITPCIQRTLQCRGFKMGEVNRARSVTVSTGGKAINVARALKILGCFPLVTGFAGGETGRLLIAHLERMAVENDFVHTGKATRVCTTVLDETTGAVTEIVEEASVPTETELTALNDTVAGVLSRCGIIVAAGALPPGSRDDIYARLAATVAPTGLPVIIDTHGQPLLEALKCGPVMAKLNREELGKTCQSDISSDDELLAAASNLLARGAQWVLVTDGPRSAYLSGCSGVWLLEPPAVTVVNDVGCGDAATAGIACALSRGVSMAEAVLLGMACGAANAMTLTPGEIAADEVGRLTGGVRVRRL